MTGASPGGRRGGREKGTLNKTTQAVAKRLEALGCDPIEGMARIAMDESQPMALSENVSRTGSLRCGKAQGFGA